MATSTIDLISQRLQNQRLVRSTLQDPTAVVWWLGAVQAQDYPGAKWALGQRTKGTTDVDVERAYDDGALLRTHVMRPTWHFVAPEDIRWMLALTAPRVMAVMASYDRKLELDTPLFMRSHRVLQRALSGGRHLTRTELAAALGRVGIVAHGQRLGHLMLRAELDAVVCSGPMRGKRFTYALVEERVPPTPRRSRDESLAELTKRYFTSHGPATLRDFAWWSGLTMRDAKAGIEMGSSTIASESIDGITYWFAASQATARRVTQPFARLLPNYDEYGIAYKDRDAFIDRPLPPPTAGATEFPHLVIVNGKWVGSWKRTIAAKTVGVELRLRRRLTQAELATVAAEADRYGAFLNREVVFTAGPTPRL